MIWGLKSILRRRKKNYLYPKGYFFLFSKQTCIFVCTCFLRKPERSLIYIRLILSRSVVCLCTETQTMDAQWSLFSSKSQTFGLGQTIWADKFWGIWSIFRQFISTHFGTVSSWSMFSINQLLFLQKTKPLYPFEFWLQRIRDLAILCP
jgi:hypothetical protein